MHPAVLPFPLFFGALGSEVASAARSASVLDHAAVESAAVARLWWFFFIVCAAVYVVVLGFLLAAAWRARRTQSREIANTPVNPLSPSLDRPLVLAVSSAVGLTVALLFTLLLRDFFTLRALQPPSAPDALTVRITGHQWWWQVQYEDAVPSNLIRGANEIHLPAGRPVNLILQSTDVIHSFWVPSLTPKKDLVPGHPTTLWLQPKTPGLYYGQCAEFCGLQHANMKLLVKVDTPEEFAAWQEAQRRPAPEPSNDRQRRGRELFLTTSCVMCHAIQGTLANSHVGPGLTHFASRKTLGAGVLQTTPENLRQWIRDPQLFKPGVRMPQNTLSEEDLDALTAYLLSLH
jgi:cytochrome c oxidase subunit 2